ncbi:MAG: DUF4443 domain-containing protein [Thermococci archaeon]|nr:DUF4443 domain-containing protein [Thermococci archaeon]
MDWKRGAYPEFEMEDVVAAIFMLKEPMGRKSLADALGIGEGSARTMLKKMNSAGIINSTQRGHILTKKGLELLNRLGDLFSEAIPVGFVEGYPAYSLRVPDPPEFKSIELRDEAIRYFAKGAMILLVKNGTPVFPEDQRPVRDTLPELYERLKALDFKDGDLILVTWSDEPSDAIKSAYHVAISLKRNSLPVEIEELLGA